MDHVDVFEKIMDEPDKAPVMLRLLPRETLADTAEYTLRRIDSFASESSEAMAKELEVSRVATAMLNADRLAVRG